MHKDSTNTLEEMGTHSKKGEPELHWLLAFFVYFSYATIIGVRK
jgi:hypothetical protein